MWPVDYFRVPGCGEHQSSQRRVLFAFLFFTASFLFALRGFLAFPLSRSLFDSVCGGVVMAGAMLWRDRRRARRDAGSEVPHRG